MKRKILWFLSPTGGDVIMSGNLRRISYWWSVFRLYSEFEIVFVISGNSDNSTLKKCYEDLGMRVIVIPEVYPFYKAFYGKGKGVFRHIIQEEKPDIVHSILVQADIIVAYFKKEFNFIHVSSLEGALFSKNNCAKYYVYKWFYKYYKETIDATISLCNYTCKENIELCDINPAKVHVIYSGLDLSLFKPNISTSQVDFITIGFLGNVSHGKLPELFIRAIPLIIEKHTNVRFVFGGIGPDLDNMKKLASQLCITDYIEFLGYVCFVPDFFKCIDIYSFTSVREGLPWSVLEAMACGKAIVASPVGGVPELIKDYETGLILPSNDFTILANKLVELIEHEELRKYIGCNAHILMMQHYTIERECNEISQLYNDLLL